MRESTKFPLDDQLWGHLMYFIVCYVTVGVVSCGFWVITIEEVSSSEALHEAYIVGRVCHTWASVFSLTSSILFLLAWLYTLV